MRGYARHGKPMLFPTMWTLICMCNCSCVPNENTNTALKTNRQIHRQTKPNMRYSPQSYKVDIDMYV